MLDAGGAVVGEVRYKAWGETRYTWGTIPTSLGYTGQRQEAALGRASLSEAVGGGEAGVRGG